MSEQHDMSTQTEKKDLLALEQAWRTALHNIAIQHGLNTAHLGEDEIAQEIETRTLAKFSPGREQPTFIVLTAPTGVGKTTVGRALEKAGVQRLPRVNTRASRPGEEDGVDYIFVTADDFERMRQNGELICPTATEENAAGIPRQALLDAISRGDKFYIDSGAGTARSIKAEPSLKGIPFALVFLLPPSFQEMIARARERSALERTTGTSAGILSEEWLYRRLERAVNHLTESASRADAYVVNDRVDRAVDRLKSLFV